MKWSFVPRNSPKPKYIMVNADESEPGTCKDRLLIEYDPHQMIEGMMIAGLAVGAQQGYVYIRGEYRYLIDIMDRAIDEAYARGYLGDNILGTRRDVRRLARIPARALMSAARNRRCSNRSKASAAFPESVRRFPAVAGVYQSPTVLNNVETFCAVPPIILHGRRLFRGAGHAEEWRHAAVLSVRAHQQARRLRAADGLQPDAHDQRSRRRDARREEAEGRDSRRILVPAC